MLKDFLAKWGFVLAGILFFVVGIMPPAGGGPLWGRALSLHLTSRYWVAPPFGGGVVPLPQEKSVNKR